MNHGYLTASSIRVDEDEGRIVLLIDSDEEDTITVNIHGIALDFYDTVRREIGPWAAEADSARRAVRNGVTLEEYVLSEQDADGYALYDPKSPGFHDRMSEIHDSREGK